jgi:hypothetical protein
MHSSFRRSLAWAAIIAVCGCGGSGDNLTASSDLSSATGNGPGNGKGNGNGSAHCNQDHKILICHIPPGNPSNWHEICIDLHAWDAHKRNHGDNEVDALGECPPPPDCPSSCPGEPDGGESDGGQSDGGQPDGGSDGGPVIVH